MRIKKFRSLIEAVLSASGFLAISGYRSKHVSPDNAEREVNRVGGVVKSCFPMIGVNESFDGVYLRFPFDGGTYDVAKDRNHHTTCDVASVLTGQLHNGLGLVMVTRNEKGQFEKFGIEVDTLCPQLPEEFLPNYLHDRGAFELASDELGKAVKQAKDRGLIATRAQGTPSGKVFYRVEETRKTWDLAGLPSNGRFAWKSMDNESLLSRISVLETQTKNLADGWRAVASLQGIKEDSQVFRILDAGLVEKGKYPAIKGEKIDASYIEAEQFAEMVTNGEIEITTKGEKVSGRKVVATT